ncbi:PREDICTED: SH3 domain-containing kinase-binding protein 1-like [Nicrophorus vespilloides]|uniref:SH3 domain-containing kinase-binding protein 1-like n=1 Tax=Nicrophorus vespilloides TaxID=110193 RepID=A0ABM1NI53_NICVS|nr:PREDICTED: SH3 domain-containing kinase-binding protein 1-like [Nicrophorus vespilloides]
MEAIVEHDYVAKEPDELTIKQGDIIRDVINKQAGWCEGTLKDRKGLFPDNFVKLMHKVTMRSRKDVSRIRKCRVIFSYKQDHEDELSLSVDDVIEIIGEEEEGWWRGTLNGKTGVFPSNFVEEIVPSVSPKCGSVEDLVDADIKIPSLPPKPTKILCEVKYAYKSQNDDELSLKEGDIITLISKDGQDAGWWRGELNGRIGVFPDNFVVIIDEKLSKEDRKLAAATSTNHINKYIASERKSFEAKVAKPQQEPEARAVPPAVPGKKPSLAIKKSPSGSGGIISGLRKKISDVVDGSSVSKKSLDVKTETTVYKPEESENAFDQVERNSMLVDVRANRAKPPGRRPPSVILKDGEQTIAMQNGNSDYGSLEENLLNSSGGGIGGEDSELMKPKVPGWDKQKVPWLEEMKQNQAKRTSTSPGPETRNRLTTPDKLEEKETSPVEMSKSMPMPTFTKILKTPPSETDKRPAIPTHRPQSIEPVKPTTKISPIAAPMAKTPSPIIQKPPIVEKPSEIKDKVPMKQYNELLDRLQHLEALVEKQNQVHKMAIDDLRGKLQVETDMRMLLQAELEKVAQCVLQV